MSLETDLRDRLHATAWRAGAGGDDLAAADAVIARRKSERRQRAVTLAVGVCVVLLVALVPILTEYQPNHAAPATTTRSAPQWTEPTRGSLAHDRAFLEAIRTRDWPGAGQGSTPVATRVVAFAGDADGSRFALVVGVGHDRLVGLWFTGPAGSPARLLDPGATVTVVQPQDASLSAMRTGASGTTVVVLTRPGDRAEVSWHATVDADGQVRRSWQPMTTADGAATAHLADGSISASIRYRVLRGGQSVAGAFLGGTYMTSSDGLAAAAGQQPRRPSDGPVSTTAVSLALQQVALPTGVPLADLHPVLLWSGSATTTGGQSTQVATVAVTMPSGAIVVSTGFEGGDGAMSSTCGDSAHPAGTPLDGLLVVTECDLPSGPGVEHMVVVSAPTGYDRVRLLSSTGRVLADQPLARGAAILPDPGTVATAVVSGPGRPDVTVAPANQSRDIFADN